MEGKFTVLKEGPVTEEGEHPTWIEVGQSDAPYERDAVDEFTKEWGAGRFMVLEVNGPWAQLFNVRERRELVISRERDEEEVLA